MCKDHKEDTEYEKDKKTYTLLDANRQPYQSDTPGTFGGNRKGKLYGRLDCPTALRAIAKGGYVKNRVFFADEQVAISAGYRPCAVCLPKEYAHWKKENKEKNI